jgi:hypothetical protein
VNSRDGTAILEANRAGLPLWRLGSEFVRPKWGIYRSLKDRDSLRPDEESLAIAALQISRGIDEPTA